MMKRKQFLKPLFLLCALLVGGLNSVWAEDVTFDFNDYKGKGTQSSGSEYTMVKDVVSIGNDKFFGNNNYAHFYANGTITITPAVGVTITKVVITASSSSYNGYQSNGTITASVGEVSGSGTTVTWTGSATSAFTLENNKQIRWTSIVVTYTSGGSQSDTWTVTYNANGATSGTVPTDDTEYDADNNMVTVLGNTGSLVKTGYTFDGWNTKADGTGDDYAKDDNFTISANTTLYAKWEANTYDVILPAADDYGTYTMDKSNPVAYGTEVTLTYTPAAGYENYAATWSVNGTAISGNKFTMPSEAVTITATVEEVVDYAALPFEYDGGRSNMPNGLTQNGLDSDYGSSPKMKFNGSGDWVILKINEAPGTLTFDIKNNSFSGGTFKVQTSVDGETYTDLQTYTSITNTQSEEFKLVSTVRYIKWIYTEKVSGNVGLGNIKLTKASTELSIDANNVELTAEETSGEIAFTINNPVSGTSLTASSEDDWISNVTVDSDNSKVTFTTSANTGAAREGTITLTYGTLTKDVTVSQKKPAAQAVDGVFDFSFADEIDYGTGMQPSDKDIKEATTFTAGNVTLVAEPTATNKYFRWWSDGTLRFYTDTKMTISVPNGYVITKIDFEGTQHLDAISADPGTYEAASTEKAATWTGAAQSVELVRNGSNPFFTMITVAYTEATQISFSKEYISYCSDKALDFTNVEGLEALVVTKVNETSVSTEAVETVPAGVGVILHKTGEATSFNVPVAATATDPATNYLVGVLEDTNIGGNGTDYVLKDGKFMKANAGTLAAGKAYLKADANAAPALTIGYGDEGTTGIRSIDNGQLTIDNVYYDLSGRRVAEPTKGVYIVNGKKVVIK